MCPWQCHPSVLPNVVGITSSEQTFVSSSVWLYDTILCSARKWCFYVYLSPLEYCKECQKLHPAIVCHKVPWERRTHHPKNIKWKIQELEDLCGLSLRNHQSRTFSATLFRRVSGTYCTNSSHTSILLFCVPSFHMVVKGGYLGTWVLARFEIGACRRQGREDQELPLDLPG